MLLKELRVFGVLQMWDFGELLVYEIYNSKLVLQEKVVQV